MRRLTLTLSSSTINGELGHSVMVGSTPIMARTPDRARAESVLQNEVQKLKARGYEVAIEEWDGDAGTMTPRGVQ